MKNKIAILFLLFAGILQGQDLNQIKRADEKNTLPFATEQIILNGDTTYMQKYVFLENRNDSLCVKTGPCLLPIGSSGNDALTDVNLTYNQTLKRWELFVSDNQGGFQQTFIPYDPTPLTISSSGNGFTYSGIVGSPFNSPPSIAFGSITVDNGLDSEMVNDSTLRVYIGRNDGFLTGYVRHDSIDVVFPSGLNEEIDPTVGDHIKDITQDDIDDWNNDAVDDADNDSTNEIQDTSNIEGLQEYVENHGADGFEPNTDTQLQESDITAMGFIQDPNDADNDPNNEIETWSTLQGIPSDILDGDDVGFWSENINGIHNDGSVGIGVNLPLASLHLGTNDDVVFDNWLWFDINKRYGIRHNNSTKLIFNINSAEVMNWQNIGGTSVSQQNRQFSAATTADNFPSYAFLGDTNTGMYLDGADLSLIHI